MAAVYFTGDRASRVRRRSTAYGMQPSTPSTTTADASPTPKAREPKLWVLAVLAVVHLVGIACGFRVWYSLDQPGKDPLAELYRCLPIDFVLAAIAYALCFRRTWRLTVAAVAVALLLGATTGLAAVGWHLLRFGWN